MLGLTSGVGTGLGVFFSPLSVLSDTSSAAHLSVLSNLNKRLLRSLYEPVLAQSLSRQAAFSNSEVNDFARWLSLQDKPLDALRQRFQEDFKAQDTVSVDGWQLAKSEALLQIFLQRPFFKP